MRDAQEQHGAQEWRDVLELESMRILDEQVQHKQVHDTQVSHDMQVQEHNEQELECTHKALDQWQIHKQILLTQPEIRVVLLIKSFIRISNKLYT